MSTLTTRRAERPYRHFGLSPLSGLKANVTYSRSGTYQTRRVYADFVVDGLVLSDRAHRRRDLISSLGWGPREVQDVVVDQLLLLRGSSAGRVALYVCPECGDLHCGAVTVAIQREGDAIVWRDFGYETGLDIDPPEPDTEHLMDLGPYRFDPIQYETSIRAGYAIGGFSPEDTSRLTTTADQ
jgi:hypothetical protein